MGEYIRSNSRNLELEEEYWERLRKVLYEFADLVWEDARHPCPVCGAPMIRKSSTWIYLTCNCEWLDLIGRKLK